MRTKYFLTVIAVFILFIILDMSMSTVWYIYITPILVSFLIVKSKHKESIYLIALFALIFDSIFSTFVGFYLFIVFIMASISFVIKKFYTVNEYLMLLLISSASEFLLIIRVSLRNAIIFALIALAVSSVLYPLLINVEKLGTSYE
jgi:membrane-associated HD superfamily phosphohydrolase